MKFGYPGPGASVGCQTPEWNPDCPKGRDKGPGDWGCRMILARIAVGLEVMSGDVSWEIKSGNPSMVLEADQTRLCNTNPFSQSLSEKKKYKKPRFLWKSKIASPHSHIAMHLSSLGPNPASFLLSF